MVKKAMVLDTLSWNALKHGKLSYKRILNFRVCPALISGRAWIPALPFMLYLKVIAVFVESVSFFLQIAFLPRPNGQTWLLVFAQAQYRAPAPPDK